jgi:hypothetical protein
MNPKETDANIERAFGWAQKLGSGRCSFCFASFGKSRKLHFSSNLVFYIKFSFWIFAFRFHFFNIRLAIFATLFHLKRFFVYVSCFFLFSSRTCKFIFIYSNLGKFDANTFIKVVLTWANSPEPTPEADTLLPFFRNCN